MLMDHSAVGPTVCDRDYSGRRRRTECSAPTGSELEVQLGEGFVARRHGKWQGLDRDSIGAMADRIHGGAHGAGRADEWLERDQPCSDLAERRVARENCTRPLQRNRRSSLVRDDYCDRKGCPRDEADDRGHSYLDKSPPVSFASPNERRLGEG